MLTSGGNRERRIPPQIVKFQIILWLQITLMVHKGSLEWSVSRKRGRRQMTRPVARDVRLAFPDRLIRKSETRIPTLAFDQSSYSVYPLLVSLEIYTTAICVVDSYLHLHGLLSFKLAASQPWQKWARRAVISIAYTTSAVYQPGPCLLW